MGAYSYEFIIVDSIALLFAVLITVYSLRTLRAVRRMMLKTTLMLPTLYAGVLLFISYFPSIFYGLTDDDIWMLIHHALIIVPFIALLLGIRSYEKNLKITA